MAASALPVLRRLFALLYRIYNNLSFLLGRTETEWRLVPGGSVEPLLSALKPATRKTYLHVLREFESFAQAARLPLQTRRDVDLAAFRFILGHTKSRGENLIAALIKCYPPLKGHLVWAPARLRVLAVSAPPIHHLPMDWLIVVALAFMAAKRGRPRHGALLLLQWRFGLRPSEALGLRGKDLHDAAVVGLPGRLSWIQVGALRGTKAGRPQIVRAWPQDWEANWFFSSLARTTAADTCLSSMVSLYHLQSLITRGLADLDIDLRFTPHCPRAGWATYRHTVGQPFADLREDGRWRTEASLRVYLDAVSNTNALAVPSVARQLDWFRTLASTLPSWLKL